jgi:D-sedoheptulose 7-phosphate isomerase
VEYLEKYLFQASEICRLIDRDAYRRLVDELTALKRRNGRLFILGVGGSAANCGHAVNDFRKLCGIEAYAPTDNVAELTARTNDEGWDTVFAAYLRTSKANGDDAILVLSVGGGNAELNVSPNIVRAVDEALERDMRILGIVGRDGGYTGRKGHAVVIIPTVDADAITPHSEAFQAVVWHGLVCHPELKAQENKWEGLKVQA